MLFRRVARGAAIALVAGLATAESARSQAFLQWDQSARVLAMGGAASGLSDDPTAAFSSPAAIVRLPGTQIHVGAAASARTGSFDAFDAPDTDADLRWGGSPSIYVTHAIAQGVTGGLSITTPWRAKLAWDDPSTFVGRFRATRVGLRGVIVNPVVAYEVAAGWAVAAGVAIVDASLTLGRFEQDPALSALGGEGPIALARGEYDVGGNGAGWNLAGHWRPRDDFAAGLQVRGPVPVDLSGSVDFTVVAPAELRAVVGSDGRTIGERLDERFADEAARTRLELPAIAVGGVTWSPIPTVILAADLQWAGWSRVDELRIEIADTTLVDRIPMAYDDAWAIRLGAEARPRGGLRVRVGYARESSPAPLGGVTPLLPDADRDAATLGVGFRWMETDLEFGYRLAVLEDRDGVAFPANATAPDGRYEAVEHRFAIGATRRF
jgi:long-chain fatty acid transport protein